MVLQCEWLVQQFVLFKTVGDFLLCGYKRVTEAPDDLSLFYGAQYIQ